MDAAENISPPVSNFVRATVTSSERITLPTAQLGQYLTFIAEAQDVWITFGKGAITASKTAVSTLSTNTPSAATNGTFYIPAGQVLHFRVPSNGSVTDFAHISSATTGFIRWFVSSGRLI